MNNETFLAAVAARLEEKGYRIGVEGREVNATKAKWGMRIGITAAKLGLHALGVKLPPGQHFHPVSSHMTAEKLTQALAPFDPCFDLVGWSLAPMPPQNSMFLVAFADKLPPDMAAERFNKACDLAPGVAKLGIKIKGQHQGIIATVLLAYFDEGVYKAHLSRLQSQGSPWKFWAKVWVRTGFLHIPQRSIAWSKHHGLNLGFNRKDPLTNEDLEAIFSSCGNS